MPDLDYQELIQHSLRGTNPDATAKVVKKELSPQMGLFGEEPEEPKKAKKESVKKEAPAAEKRGVQSDMFEQNIKDLKRAEAEKRFKEMQKLEERPLPKYHRMPGTGGGSGAGVDVEGLPQRLRPGPKKMAKGGSVKVSSASKRADGIAKRGKTRGRMI